MKLCIIAPMFPLPREQPSMGPDNVIYNLVKEIIAIDTELSIDIVTIHNKAKNKFVDERFSNVRVHYYPRSKYLPRNFGDPIIIKKFLKNKNYDIIHSHCTFALARSMNLKVPKVLTLHGIYHIEKKFVKNPLSILMCYDYGTYLLKKILPKLDGFVAISPYVIEELKEIGLDAKIQHVFQINNPIDQSFFEIDINQEHHNNLIFFPAVINARKNQLLAINAVNMIKNQIDNFQLVLTGNCGDDNYLKEINDLVHDNNLTNNVSYLGRVSRDEIMELYHKSSIIYLLSKQETQPLAILEAMATGNPVIASNIKCNSYLVEEGVTGYLVDLNDFEKISQHTIELFTNTDKRMKMAKNARQIAERKYRADVIAKKTLEMYYEILSSIN